MAARTYGELRAEALELLNRDDCTTTLMDQFLMDGINRIHRKLRIPSMEQVIDLTANAAGNVSVPQNFLEIIDIEDDANSEFIYLPPDEFRKKRRLVSIPFTGQVYYTRRAREFQFYPAYTEGDAIRLYCYTDPPEINSDDDTIPLLIFAPEFAKYAALIDAAVYFEDDRQANFAAVFTAMKEEIEEQQEDQETSNINASFYPEIQERF
ncbi:MAG: hypothetical protein AAF608_05005 [Pseudomonadota bacterium]